MSNSKRAVLLRIAGLCGVVGPVISLLFIALAIADSPWFNWFSNALSDLGVHEAALIFNSGLILGGSVTAVFAVGLIQILKKQFIGLLGTFTLVLSTISLIAVGVFTESAGRIHFYVSLSFFGLLAVSILLIGVALLRESSQRYWGLFSIFTVVGAIVIAGVAPHEGAAIPEIIGSLTASMWSVVFGIKLFKSA